MSQIVRSIVAQASTLWERLDGSSCMPDETVTSEEHVRARLERWQERVGKGGVAVWEKRIYRDGWDLSQVQTALGGVRFADDGVLPRWATVLEELMRRAPDYADSGDVYHFGTEESEPIPFQELLFPCVVVAEHLLRARFQPDSSPVDLLSASALRGLRRTLLSALSAIAGRTFLEEFSARRTVGHNLLLSMASPDPVKASTDKYHSFVRETLEDGYQSIFQRYPVLARLLVTRMCGYVDALEEFLLRFVADHALLAEHWPDVPDDPGAVEMLQMDVADVHDGGRTVMIVGFDSGCRIVYKPRPLGAEAAWNELRSWCRERGLVECGEGVRILERDGYGWMSFVQGEPCRSRREVEAFYRDAGCSLALLYVLGGTDFHWENLIASGSRPVLIDLETVMNHRIAHTMEGQQDEELEEGLSDAVLRTGMLPNWTVDRGSGEAVDISGLCGGVEPGATVLRPTYRSVNTDDMHLVRSGRKLPAQPNLPTLNGEAVRPGDFLDELLEAFSRTYRFVREHRAEIIAAGGPGDRLRSIRLRHVYRATRVYATLLQRTYQPEFLQDGADRSIELDVMSWSFMENEGPSVFWPVARAEIRSLERMDVPVFHARAAEHVMRSPGVTPIVDAFISSAWDMFCGRLERMDEADLQLQSAMIRGTFTAHEAGLQNAVRERSGDDSHRRISPNPSRLPDPEELVRAATVIGERLLRDEMPGRNGDAIWLGLDYLPAVERYQCKPLDEGLYNGSSGIALFLGALGRVTGDGRYRQAALRGVNRLRRRAGTHDAPLTLRWADRRGISLNAGLAGGIFSLLRLGNLLHDDDLVADAVVLSSLIDHVRIGLDRTYDVIGGSAGAILALVALYDHTQNRAVLDTAMACGDHLLHHRTVSRSRFRVWKTIGDRPLTGYSHGMSGIADALLRLADRSTERRFRDAALEALAYEADVFLPDRKNWPDFRGTAQNDVIRCAHQWCHGAAGIGFARLRAGNLLQDAATEADLEAALTTIADYGVGTVDDLCCGNMGRIDFLFTAGQELGRQELCDSALRAVAQLLEDAREHGSFRLLDSTFSDVGIPGLFKGTAGIGYQLLRLARPVEVPSILGFDAA